MRQHKKLLLMSFVLALVYLNQPTRAYAWFFDWGWGDHHENRGYSAVIVGDNRYYYNDGVFYSGAPGSYVVVGAPVGAVVYDVPPGFARVDIDGDDYYVYHDVYYRPYGRGYRVVERPQRHEHEGQRDGEERHEQRDEHH
jgi:hypothetical protein